MSEADFWLAFCAQTLQPIPVCKLATNQVCRAMLAEAASETAIIAFGAVRWTFRDGSRLLATDDRVLVMS
jgi:hypothetical protein